MKKWIRQPLVWIVVIELVIGTILFLLGFRITYTPQLENSWGAISACAAWAGAVATTLAVIVAIRIPKAIAKQQNKIALFEKRFAFYETLCDCISFGQLLDNVQINKEAQMFFVSTFSKVRLEGWTENEVEQEAIRLYCQAMNVLNQGVFLFDFDTKETINSLIVKLTALLYTEGTNEGVAKCCMDFKRAANEAKEQLLPKIEAALKL